VAWYRLAAWVLKVRATGRHASGPRPSRQRGSRHRAHAGVSINRNAKPATIAYAVRRVLDDPRYREAAEQLGWAIRRDASSGALVAELETESVV
jgi:hypothetical protein